MTESITKTQKLEFQHEEVPGLISIVMCVYNSGKYIQKMLDSIYAQTYKKFEVIVAYDTKSSDNSLEILKEYADKYGLIIDYGNDSSIGFARVRGARLARGEYFIYLDSDDVIIPTYLDDLLECFRRYPKINVAYCGYSEVNEPKSNLNDVCMRASQSTNIYSLLNSADCHLHNYRNLKSQYYISGVPWTWLVRRRYLKEIDCYFPDLQCEEDKVYVCQLLIHAEKIGHSSRKGYIYLVHTNSLCHKQKPYTQMLTEKYQSYNHIISLLASAGYEKIGIRERKNAIRDIKLILVLNLRVLPYLEFKSRLEEEGFKYLPLHGNLKSKLSCLCFNISKKLYWNIHRILDSKKTHQT